MEQIRQRKRHEEIRREQKREKKTEEKEGNSTKED